MGSRARFDPWDASTTGGGNSAGVEFVTGRIIPDDVRLSALGSEREGSVGGGGAPVESSNGVTAWVEPWW